MRTMFCGKLGCEWPKKEGEKVNLSLANRKESSIDNLQEIVTNNIWNFKGDLKIGEILGMLELVKDDVKGWPLSEEK